MAIADRALAAFGQRNADVVLFQREMISTLYSVERLCTAPAVFDVDDAIWLNQRWASVDRLASRCRLVLCGNSYIADHFSQFAPVRVLPTGVDIDRWKPASEIGQGIMVWSGSSAGLPYLLAIESALEHVLSKLPDATVRIVCDRFPPFKRLPRHRVEYVQWSEQTEVAALQGASIGLMPMPDTPWTRGKCSFKLLTYLACGLAAIASPHGMNREVIAGGGVFGAETIDDWTDMLLTLLQSPSLARSAGADGRANVERRYSAMGVARGLANALMEAAA